jgi:thymidine kinase
MDNKGRLDLIIGPMYSGKSTHLIGAIYRYESIGKKVMCINHNIDNRYGTNVISSHNMVQRKCISTEKLVSIFDNTDYTDSHIVVIEEGQFFTDLLYFVERAVDMDKKHVIVAGLSGDFKRRPFGQILDLVPIADSIEKLTAFCKLCNDGTFAHFSKRIVGGECETTTDPILVGTSDTYLPVCRFHYLNYTDRKEK